MDRLCQFLTEGGHVFIKNIQNLPGVAVQSFCEETKETKKLFFEKAY